jgi:hypothetical protein
VLNDTLSSNLDPRVQVAIMLITLGVSTVEQIRGYFSKVAQDDDALAAIMAEVEQRIGRLQQEIASGTTGGAPEAPQP